jgi:hypothetical protein
MRTAKNTRVTAPRMAGHRVSVRVVQDKPLRSISSRTTCYQKCAGSSSMATPERSGNHYADQIPNWLNESPRSSPVRDLHDFGR